ncbi:hypothetical protein N7448_011313 [Penicillium atrosanguineum]|nr:hypothetical protein N7448_011313 [Penicillium atrosanguineum]
MPPIRNKNSRNFIEQDVRVSTAIQTYQNKKVLSIKEAARRFQLPFTNFQKPMQRQNFRHDTRANNRKLAPNEDESLLRQIVSMDTRESAARPSMVRNIANILHAERPGGGDANISLKLDVLVDIIMRGQNAKIAEFSTLVRPCTTYNR